jgi:hypothetical protein
MAAPSFVRASKHGATDIFEGRCNAKSRAVFVRHNGFDPCIRAYVALRSGGDDRARATARRDPSNAADPRTLEHR